MSIPTTPTPAAATRVATQLAGVSAERGQALQRAAQAFESQALFQFFQPMFAGVDSKGGPFGGGQGEAMFRPMLLEKYAERVAAAGGMGLAQPVLREMLRAQEASQARLDGGAR
jgi:peptidoglycan hydrolase FlgJ